MRRCTGPVSCLPFGVVEKPDGLNRGGEAYLSNAPSHPAGNASFIHSLVSMLSSSHSIEVHSSKGNGKETQDAHPS